MSRRLSALVKVFLGASLTAVLVSVAVVPAGRSAAAEATWLPIAVLPVGTGPGQISYARQNGDIAHGPQALTSYGSDLYVLDSVNARIHILRGGTVSATLPVPTGRYPRELSVDGSGINVLESDDRILMLGHSGALQRQIRLPRGLAAPHVIRLASDLAGPRLWTGTSEEFASASLPPQIDLDDVKSRSASRGIAGPDGRRWITDGGPLGGALRTTDGTVSARLSVKSYFGTARLVGFDPQSRPYVVVEDVSDASSVIHVEQSLRRFATDGRPDGVARLPYERFVANPRRSIEVAADGTVYAMVPAAAGLEIYRLNLGSTFTSRLPATHPGAAQARHASQGSHLARPLADVLRDRKTTNARADTMVNSLWRWHTGDLAPTYDYYHWGSPRDTTKPSQLVGLTDGVWVRGVPYTWGGFDSTAFGDGPGSTSDGQLWTGWDGATGAVNYYASRNPAERGPLVGNIPPTNAVCPPDCYIGGTAGIDCSGFVYAAAGYVTGKKRATGDLMTGGGLAGLDAGWTGNIQPMNYFASSQHTFYYEYRKFDNPSGFNTLESTVAITSQGQGAARFFRTWGDAGGYQHKSWWPFTPGDTYAMAHTEGGRDAGCYGVRGQNKWYVFYSTAAAVTLTHTGGGDPDLWVFYYNGGNPPATQVGPPSVNGPGADEYVALPGPGWYYAMVHVDSTRGGCTRWNINW